MDIFGILSMIGGLALFLYGMEAMGAGLSKLSGGRMERLLEKLTSKRIMAVLLGAGVTAVIQSSSATTVMVVGFVNSGIMKLNQAVGIIMGANIGTTITSWLLSLTGIQGSSFILKMLKPSSFSPILAIVGIIFIMFTKDEKKKEEMNMSLYSVVVPVYNSEHTLGELYTRLEKVFRETLKEDFELILVDDGSKDRSYEIMTELREKDHRVRIIQMARNFGQHPALLCGFAHVKGEFVVTMDDDLQHQPEELPKMVRTMQERPDVDVIIASYEGRKHGPIRKLGTKFSVWATSKMLGKDPDLQITSYRLIRRFLVDAMVKTNTYLPQIGNLLIRSSNRIINVPVQHADRAYGKSGYSFKRLLKDLIYDITTHTAFPLLLVRNIGIVSFLISVVLSVCYLVRYFTLGISVQGWTSLMLVMLAFFGLILLSIGIMGIYLMNILNEAKKMPHYVIRREDTDE